MMFGRQDKIPSLNNYYKHKNIIVYRHEIKSHGFGDAVWELDMAVATTTKHAIAKLCA